MNKIMRCITSDGSILFVCQPVIHFCYLSQNGNCGINCGICRAVEGIIFVKSQHINIAYKLPSHSGFFGAVINYFIKISLKLI